MDHTNFFFVYNKELFDFLYKKKKLSYITIAKNSTTGKTFSMFYKNEYLQNAISEYKHYKKHDI